MVNPYESHVIDDDDEADEDDLLYHNHSYSLHSYILGAPGANIRMQVAQGYRETGKEG